MNPDNLSIVLVKPQGPINIGSVARVMMNFGFTRLRLVEPTPEYLSLAAKKMALTAFPILETALVFDDLKTALSDIQAAFGATRRFGKYRENFFTPAEAAETLNQNFADVSCALVLGPEDNGLDTRDLSLCRHFITIPTHDGFQSMNLSHSLAVLLYEISISSAKIKKPAGLPVKKLAGGDEIEHMVDHMRETLLSIEFLDKQNPDHLLRTFRRIFGIAGLSSREVKIIEGLMSRIDWTEKERRKHTHVYNG